MSRKISLIHNSVFKFIKEAYQELQRVVWPKRANVIRMTILVVFSIIVGAAVIGIFDYGVAKIVKILIELR